MNVSTYVLHAANGRRIRVATQVEHEGRVVHFTERLPKGEAIRLAADKFGLVAAVNAFAAGEIEKYEFYAATASYPAELVSAAADIPLPVVLDRRRYLAQLAQMGDDTDRRLWFDPQIREPGAQAR